jgi:predicted TIM-barrel fold metal-dependent hydrolase
MESVMPSGMPIVDTMIGFPVSMFEEYEFIRRQLHDAESKDDFDFPVEYMFYGRSDPIEVTLEQMDRFGIDIGLVPIHDEVGRAAVKRHPNRFVALGGVEPHRGADGLRAMDRMKEEFDVRAFTAFPSGFEPPVPIDDRLMYPIYSRCVELDVPIFVCAGVPGPRLPMAAQHVERIDNVMYDFPDLVFVTRHGCEPWQDLAVKLMLKWPNLYYSTSAFAPLHYPHAIIDYANTRGSDKVLYAGYFPMGMSLERIMTDMPNVGFAAHVWPKFLHENARKILKLTS